MALSGFSSCDENAGEIVPFLVSLELNEKSAEFRRELGMFHIYIAAFQRFPVVCSIFCMTSRVLTNQ
jgi:hypothetical protein